jgi:nicotinamide-nucleotide amidase
MWKTALETPPMNAVLSDLPTYRREIVRLFGLPESEIANSLRAAQQTGLELERLEITTCLRRGEIEIATRFEPPAQPAYDALIDFIRERHGERLFSEDGSTIDEQAAQLLAGRTVAVAESCTGGLLAARLTERPGSSAYFLGGAVVYSNEAKVALAGVDPALITRVGAVSDDVARALARGAIERFGADIGVGVTGIAGPEGGSDEKPVGLVCFTVAERHGAETTLTTHLPGGRADIRERSTTVALHLLKRLLRGESQTELPGVPSGEARRAPAQSG